MKADYTHITMILDRSGSMRTVQSDVIGGFNAFIDEQKKVPGDCTVTLVQFDSQNSYEIRRDMAKVADVAPLGDEYQPRAQTPLYDAIGRGIVNTGESLKALAHDARPSKVVFVILTDGLENASREYDRAKVAAMTKEQTEIYKWQFVYLGANQDAMAEGAKAGISGKTSADYAEQKTSGAILRSAQKVASYRTSGAVADLNWTDKDRKELKS